MNDTVRMTAGTVFAGDYRIVRPLRSGGQGSLYVVEQLSTSKHRALKLMLPELVAQPTSRKRFELEAKIAARIQSDHIVESIASGVDQKTGIPWLVMELLEGEDLATMLQRRRHLPARSSVGPLRRSASRAQTSATAPSASSAPTACAARPRAATAIRTTA